MVIELKNFLKIFCLAIFVVTLMAESVFANPYPDTLDNGNLICVDGGMGVGRYADRSSVQVQMYAPPNYQISIKIFPVTFSEGYPLIPLSAEAAFVSAYNMRFFDNKIGYGGQRVISEDFYSALNI